MKDIQNKQSHTATETTGRLSDWGEGGEGREGRGRDALRAEGDRKRPEIGLES